MKDLEGRGSQKWGLRQMVVTVALKPLIYPNVEHKLNTALFQQKTMAKPVKSLIHPYADFHYYFDLTDRLISVIT